MTTKSGTNEDQATTGRATRAAENARERASGMAVGVMNGVRDAAQTVSERLPDAAAATKATVDEATRRMESGSDEMLIVGAAMSFGFAAGLLVGGAPRLLVSAGLIPAVAMTMTLLDRRGRVGGRTRTTS
jgi:hypothetical protein